MAEFLVRVEDKVNADPYLDAKCLKRGDVVVVCPDGWAWSALEQTLPFWRIVRVPGMALDEAEAFLASEPGDPLVNKVLQRRLFRLDLDALDAGSLAPPLALGAALAVEGAPAVQAAPLELTLDAARSLKVMKPALADPKVIG